MINKESSCKETLELLKQVSSELETKINHELDIVYVKSSNELAKEMLASLENIISFRYFACWSFALKTIFLPRGF